MRQLLYEALVHEHNRQRRPAPTSLDVSESARRLAASSCGITEHRAMLNAARWLLRLATLTLAIFAGLLLFEVATDALKSMGGQP